MNWWAIGLAGVAVLGLSSRARASSSPTLPGDTGGNWGKTPLSLRPLFLQAELAASIPGAARFLAIAASRESNWNPLARNASGNETKASRNAYEARKATRPALAYGEAAADFGSGGLFGLLAPYFLWAGVPELGGDAPLLARPPSAVFDPAIAAFGAAVYMQRIIAFYPVDDWADVRAGWASPSLLTSARGGADYNAVRTRFAGDAVKVGIDLGDRATIPATPSASGWPGVAAVYAALVAHPVNS